MDITIYQINMGRDHNRIAFEGLDLLKMYQGSDKIDSRIKQRLQVVKSERMLYAESEIRPSKQRSGRNTRLSSPPVLLERRL